MDSNWKSLVLFITFRCAAGSDQENIFALDLFKQVFIQDNSKNFVLSPPIIRASLSLLYLTANWNAAYEIQEALQLPQDKSETAVIVKNYLTNFNKNRDRLPVNAQIYRDPNELSPSLLDLINNYMEPEVSLAAFGENPNTIVSILPKTNHMPNYILLVTTLFNLTVAWKTPFNPLDGRAGVFKFSGGYYQANYMKKTARFGILKLEALTALEIPYDTHSALSMIFVMPNDEDTPLSTLVQNFSLATYQTIDARLQQRFVDVAIPRFTVDSNVQLGMSLARLGIVSSYLANAFDFYRYRGSGLGPIEHVGSIRVLEGGTVEAENAPKEAVPPALLPTFRADRPFLYLVRNTTSKDILIIGHYSHLNS
ncbi:probable serpin E3 [Armigeres subalbatus]|uniref:probable serpin E3 n=1 Tax=Armigeres subalbatus TaxID=124917 RepID=UPI002ED5E0AE